MKPYSLKNKSVLITGASSGIGEALVKSFADEGCDIILMARNVEKLGLIQQSLKGNSMVTIIELDLCSTNSIENAVKTIEEKNLSVDILVHNAGISQRALAAETSSETESKIWKTNFHGAVQLTKALLPNLKNQNRSKIILISSIVEVFGFPFRSTYSATKHALKGYFESMAFEEYERGVEVQFMLPGRVKTNISNNALKGDGSIHNQLDDGQAYGVSPKYCAGKVIGAIKSGKQKQLIGGKELIAVKLYKYFKRFFIRIAKKELDNGI